MRTEGQELVTVADRDRYITLPGGPTLSLEPVVLALDLEERGFRLKREGRYTLVVQPHNRLTPDDCRRVRRWKRQLLALLDYQAAHPVQ